MRGYKYLYQVIEGAGVFGKPFHTLLAAQAFLEKVRMQGYGYLEPIPNAEIERIRKFPDGGMQFDVRRDGKWVNSWEGRYGSLKGHPYERQPEKQTVP